MARHIRRTPEEMFFDGLFPDRIPESGHPLTQEEKEAIRAKIARILDDEDSSCHLTFRRREIIKLRFGYVNGVAYSRNQVGRRFMMSIDRVRQFEITALRTLNDYLSGAIGHDA